MVTCYIRSLPPAQLFPTASKILGLIRSQMASLLLPELRTAQIIRQLRPSFDLAEIDCAFC
jgi:hypothetical protein